MMKVLHVFKDYFPPTHGGIEHLIHEITHNMSGVESVVVTSSRQRRSIEEDDDGVRVVRVAELGRIGSVPIATGFARQIRAQAPDLVHFHMPNPTAECAYLASRIEIPSLATYHAEVARAQWLVPPYHAMQRVFLSRMRRVTVGAQAFAANTPVLRAVRDKLAVVPFGVNPDDWAARPAAADEIRAKHTGPLIAFTGRLVHYKGVHHLIRAMREVDATLVVVGWGGEIRSLVDEAKRLGLDDRVVFTGPVGNASRAAYYHAADVVVLPSTSRSEGFGMVLLEAMASGTPVVSTELGSGTSWVNVDGETGLVVPPADAGRLAAALRRLLENPRTAAAMGARGRERVRERFTRTQMVEALRRVYEDALNTEPRPRRTRVNHVITRFIVGGAQEHALETVSHLPRDRYDAWIVTGSETGPEGSLHARAADEGASLDVLPQLVRDPAPAKDALAVARLRIRFRRARPDIVHTHSSKAGIVARLAARWARVPVIVHTVHGWSFHERMSRRERFVYKRLERMVARFTDAIVVLSEEDRRKGLEARIGTPERYVKIPAGIDVGAYARKPGSRKLRDEFGIPDTAPIVGAVIRLAPQKDPMTMLEAFEKVNGDAYFVIVGDGPMRKEFDAAVSASCIRDRLFVTGVRSDVHDLVGELDVFVLTSLWEGLPLAMIEAMAAGVPVVASRVDGIAEGMTDGVEGFLVPPKDAAGFADRVRALLADDVLRKRMGEAAVERSAAFDIPNMIRRHEDLYQRLLHKHR
jgi:rhamnosyl/mannosyltransferase